MIAFPKTYTVVWLTVNIFLSHRILFIIPKFAKFRYTCICHHAVTVFSLIVFAIGPPIHSDNKHHFYHLVHAHLSLIMLRMQCLFIALFGLLAWRIFHRGVPKLTQVSSVTRSNNKQPQLFLFLKVIYCITRNIYYHGGSTFLLLKLNPVLIDLVASSQDSIILNYIPTWIWLFLFYNKINFMYRLKDMRSDAIVVPMAIVSILFDTIIYPKFLQGRQW